MFRFSLQPVLEHRKRLEDQRQREFGEAQARVEAAQRERREIDEDITNRLAQIRQGQRGGFEFGVREIIERWILAQRERAVRVDAEVVRLRGEAEKQRLRLVEAVKARMVLEKLREQEESDFRREEARAEMKLFDEIAVRDFLTEQRREKSADTTERIAS